MPPSVCSLSDPWGLLWRMRGWASLGAIQPTPLAVAEQVPQSVGQTPSQDWRWATSPTGSGPAMLTIPGSLRYPRRSGMRVSELIIHLPTWGLNRQIASADTAAWSTFAKYRSKDVPPLPNFAKDSIVKITRLPLRCHRARHLLAILSHKVICYGVRSCLQCLQSTASKFVGWRTHVGRW